MNRSKKYGICLSYISQLIKEMKPNGEKENYIFNKLKSMTESEEKEKTENGEKKEDVKKVKEEEK